MMPRRQPTIIRVSPPPEAPSSQINLLNSSPITAITSIPCRLSPNQKTRPRLMSWSHFGSVHSSLFDPQCAVHGHRALLETYAREKFLKASEELQQALAEEQRRAERRRNVWCVELFVKFISHFYAKFRFFRFSFDENANLRF